MKRIIVFCIIAMMLLSVNSSAQMFTSDTWEQKNLITAKMSQLYYELNIGINLRSGRHTADFVYMAFGYGKPTRKNAWRKFVPENNIPDYLPKSLKTKLSEADTDGLHAGKVGVGWNHWFNHSIGCYAQVSWGGVVDLSTSDNLTDEERTLLSDAKEKDTYVYNTIPVELGLTLNLWKHYHVQAGVTYMWKEIPLLTVGIGYAF